MASFCYICHMMKQKKVILITGASSGIGYDTALILAGQGHKVYGAARRVELLEKLRDKGVIPIKMDVTDEQSMADGVQTIIDAEGQIDVLVNNAGYGYMGAIENVTIAEAKRQLEVNVVGSAAHARSQIGPNNQHLIGRRQSRNPIRRLVQRLQIFGRGA